MPTFEDPAADASEAANALRGLAHASRQFDRPDDLYPVMGELLSGVRSLRQVIDQVAAAHLSHRPRALDEYGSHTVGADEALAAADELLQVGALIDQAEEHLDTASQAASHIAWQPEPVTTQPTGPEPSPLERDAAGQVGPEQRWVSVVFLQGEQADEVLELINTHGEEAGIERLTGWDYGQETTDAAMENGHVYDQPPAGALDQDTALNDYRMIHNPDLGHVGLYRQHTIDPTDQLPPEPAQPPAGGLVSGHAAGPGRGLSRDLVQLTRTGEALTAGAARAPGDQAAGRATAGEAAGRVASAAKRDSSWFDHPANSGAGSSVAQSRGMGL